ncbi:sulfotransferase family protein [Thiocapsa marina]|uniref:Sulfotransferase n=1 Tax=Thiocapsa marina 5811 TaxID=768671 RepID=F9UCN2_9GAMM|nr:sulfotransferase [Thiocapsa marina]EGV18145.1 hypothetical protein ThimaDRAFT_2684 [Thiocapsa marina 5811]
MTGVFVFGAPRSGTSALSWALAQHPGMWVSSETDFLLPLFGRGNLDRAYRVSFDRPDNGWLRKHDVARAEFAAHLGLGVAALYASRSTAPVWVDSTPGYVLMARELAELLPDARFLHLVRDGRAVVDSMLHSGFTSPWARSFATACATWRHFVVKGLEAEKMLGDRILRVSHARLLSEPQTMLEEVLSFLGQPQHPGPAAFIAGSRINSSYDNERPGDIRRAKDTASLHVERWRSWSWMRRVRYAGICGTVHRTAGLTP